MLGYGFIVIFKIDYDFERLRDGGERKIRHYYVNGSIGVACGMPLAALRNAGLATLTRTPTPMVF
jgi:iodotyrosine deiodinase